MDRPISVKESVEQGIKEAILMMNGELPEKTWEEFKEEL